MDSPTGRQILMNWDVGSIHYLKINNKQLLNHSAVFPSGIQMTTQTTWVSFFMVYETQGDYLFMIYSCWFHIVFNGSVCYVWWFCVHACTQSLIQDLEIILGLTYWCPGAGRPELTRWATRAAQGREPQLWSAFHAPSWVDQLLMWCLGFCRCCAPL